MSGAAPVIALGKAMVLSAPLAEPSDLAVPAEPGFDYSTLSPETARQARATAAHIKRSMAWNTCEVGGHLRHMKALLLHGAFTDWCEKALSFSRRTAQNYMAASEWLEGKSATLTLLPPTTIYALAAPSAPAGVVQEVVAAAEAGAPLEPSAILQRLDTARAEMREVKRALAKKPGITEADVRKRMLRKREARARENEDCRQEAVRAAAHRREVVQRFVAAHREVMAALAEAVEGEGYGFFSALRAALGDDR